jgi:ParB family transcriptional regulator, chromosome partitioning protein
VSRPKRERLGRGLGALLGEHFPDDARPGEGTTLPLNVIVPNPFQPRREFKKEELEELASSIRVNGLLQPLVVRPAPGSEDRFELVAGERRFRAVTGLGWTDVPVVVREVDDQTLLILALVENLQREALSPLEEAEGYRVLMESFDLTQGEVAVAVGKDRSTVSNLMRLLKLPASVRRLLEEERLSMGHARALLALEDGMRAGDLARRAADEGWSVREVERHVREALSNGGPPPPPRVSRGGGGEAVDPARKILEEELCQRLGTRVRLKGGGNGRGVIEVPFLNTEDFERIFSLLTGEEASDVLG